MTDMRERLESLVAEARAAGALADLRAPLRAALEEAREQAALDEPEVPGRFGIVGESPAMQAVFEMIERVAMNDIPVLIQGETGTGKELVARALHRASARADGPFLAENCAAVPANLLESELFGHVKGAFTDAVRDRGGHFVAAGGGTLFLDEIGDMPLQMQAKLLRVLEGGEVRPVGSNRSVKVDVRILAATHRDLAAMAAERTFREDLFYRLDVVRIPLPPLRDRNGDVELLVRYFSAQVALQEGVEPPAIEPDALAALVACDWPGNVRQLENEIRRFTALGRGPVRMADLTPQIASNSR